MPTKEERNKVAASVIASPLLTINGTSRTNCSGVTRRELLQIGGAGLFGMTLPGVLAAQEAQQAFAGGKAK